VEQHTTSVVDKAGRADVVLNAMGFRVVQSVPLVDLDPADFASVAIAALAADLREKSDLVSKGWHLQNRGRCGRPDRGYIDLEQRTLRTIDNPLGTRLSPMS
jgi:hypothetical protein